MNAETEVELKAAAGGRACGPQNLCDDISSEPVTQVLHVCVMSSPRSKQTEGA